MREREDVMVLYESRNSDIGAGEMAQTVRALAALHRS